MNKSGVQTWRQRFVIIYMPNILFFLILALCLLLIPFVRLPWQLFPGKDVMFPWRLFELLLGQVLMILAVMFIVWGEVSLGLGRAEGKEIGETSATSTLVTSGAYAYCRHPITLGFALATPRFALTYDFVPLLLVTLIYTSLLLALLVYEEVELLRRFGNIYTVYRQTVPFLIPQPKKPTTD